ncbi:hypothetical protein KZ773_04330 [Escherichia coli]|nr:hypothetical protein [Escherichia coli]
MIISNASAKKGRQPAGGIHTADDGAENLRTAECEDGQRAGADLHQRLRRADAAVLHMHRQQLPVDEEQSRKG